MSIKDNVERVYDRIATAQQFSGTANVVQVVAITKTHSASLVREAYNEGLHVIGENRVQEAANKFIELQDILPKLTRRLVGHLQSNKINKALVLFDTIDAVDSLKLAHKIGKKATLLNRKVPILLEVNTSGESTKYGFSPLAIDDMLACNEIQGIELHGLMTIGPLTSNIKKIRKAFIELRELQQTIKKQLSNNSEKFTELSMGMSADFELAVQEGSTMVRLGTTLFGVRK